jgi:protein gp37
VVGTEIEGERIMGKQKAGKKIGIAWTDETINPLTGCKAISPGCLNCWAADMSQGLLAKGQEWHEGLAIVGQRGHGEWTGKVDWQPEELLRFARGTPRRIFLNSISDTFYERVKRDWQDEMFVAMRNNPANEYQVLTKRAAGMLKYVRDAGIAPMSNVLMGFSAEDQRWFDERWKYAKQVVDLGWRVWVSVEPQVAPIKLGEALKDLSWVVIGGDNTKPHVHAREFDIAWAESLISECKAAGVPVFMKQVGVRPYWTIRGNVYPFTATREGKYMSEWPSAIQIQQFPTVLVPDKVSEAA